MRIEHVIFCEELLMLDKPTAKNIIPGFLIFPYEPLPDRPMFYTFSIGIVLKGSNAEEVSVPIDIKVISPSDEVIGTGSANRGDGQQTTPTPNSANVWAGFVAIDLRNFAFKEAGDYTFEFRVGNEVVTKTLTVAVAHDNK